MKRIYLCIVFVIFCHVAAAQTTLTGNPALSVSSLDSVDAEIAAINNITKKFVKSDSLQIVLSASDTGLKSSTDSNFVKNNTCVLSFIGCDESRVIMSDFIQYFYSEYLKKDNYEAAFFNARTYLFNKYPASPVIPILTCK